MTDAQDIRNMQEDLISDCPSTLIVALTDLRETWKNGLDYETYMALKYQLLGRLSIATHNWATIHCNINPNQSSSSRA